LDVNIVDISNWEKTVEVTVPYENFKKDFEKAYQDYKQNIKLGGFRKGKVPVSLIKQMFGKEIEAKTAEEKITELLKDISQEYKIKPISPAKIEEISFNKEDGLKFKVSWEVVPEIELENYKALSLEREVYKVEDEDIADALGNLREQYAVETNLDEEAQIGHIIVADFQKLDSTGVPIVGEKYENKPIQLLKKDSETENEIVEQFVGVKAGDTRNVRFPRVDPQSQQQVTDDFSVTVKEVKNRELPELDDEFAKDLGDFENLEELKAKLQKNLEFSFKKDYEKKFTEKIIDELVKTNQFELPEPMIDNYLDIIIEQMKKRPKDEINEEQIRANYRADTIRHLKWTMIKEKISELEDIKVSDSEVDDYIDKFVEDNKKDSLQIKKYYRNKENRNKLEDDLSEQKIVQFLNDQAEITEKIINRNDLKKESKIIV